MLFNADDAGQYNILWNSPKVFRQKWRSKIIISESGKSKFKKHKIGTRLNLNSKGVKLKVDKTLLKIINTKKYYDAASRRTNLFNLQR